MNEQQQPSEEELRAAYEAEIKKIRVEHVLLEHVVSMINLGMRRTGTAPGTEDERDPEQVRMAIEAIRAALPLVERAAPQQVTPIRQALSQLQLAYVRIGGQASDAAADTENPGTAGTAGQGAPGTAESGPPGGAGTRASEAPGPAGDQEEGPGPAQRSGRLWVPGQ